MDVPLDESRIRVPHRRITQVAGRAVDCNRAQDHFLVVRCLDEALKRAYVRFRAGCHAMPSEPGPENALLKYRRKHRVAASSGNGNENRGVALCRPIVEERLIPSTIYAMHAWRR